MDVTIGPSTFRVETTGRDGAFTAHAVRTGTGERFGVEAFAASADDATATLVRWLEWQHEHTDALERLQEAERAYHRVVAGAAFAAVHDSDATGGSRAALELVDAARNHL